MAEYTHIPGWLTDDLRDAKITNKMFNVMFWLFMRANFKTGIVKMVSAKRIQAEQWADDREDKRPSLRTIQEVLYRLGQCRYINSHHQLGQKGSYQVTINNYPAQTKDKAGAWMQTVLNPIETLDWHELPKERRADNANLVCADASDETSGDASADASSEVSAYTPIVTPVVTSIGPSVSPANQSVSQSTVPAAPPLSIDKCFEPSSPKSEDPFTLENYRANNYPLIDRSAWYHDIIASFYDMAGSTSRMEANEWRDVFACWELLSTKRVDEVSFVMDMVLRGQIPYYKGRKRPFDFHYFAGHYDHARDLAEEQLLVNDAKRGDLAKGRYAIEAPWNWKTSYWRGHRGQHSRIPSWSDCDHTHEGTVAFLKEAEWCFRCGAPGEFVNAQEAERQAQEASRQKQNELRERLAQYEFRALTNDEEREFYSIRGQDGWLDGMVSQRVKNGTWSRRHKDAAVLYVLHHICGSIGFAEFEALVDKIKAVDVGCSVSA